MAATSRLISTSEAAARLNTTEATVRSLLLHKELRGDTEPIETGSRHRRLVEDSSVDEFIGDHGTFPTARARHRTSTVETRLTAVENELARRLPLGVTDRRLREVIRAQSAAMDATAEAIRLTESALGHFRDGEADRSAAVQKLLDAQSSLAGLIRLEGVPDSPEGLVDEKSGGGGI